MQAVRTQPLGEVAWRVIDTPITPLTIAATPRGLVNISFDGPGATVRALRRHGEVRPGTPADGTLAEGAQQISAWAQGDRVEFDVPLDWSLTSGTQQRVLRILFDTVAYGETVTYGELADRADLPGEARLIGQIMGSNPLPVIVPCHRVLASDGLGGYGPGVELKRRILVLEGVLQPSLFD
jgi:methylated-DNA-[protein]-cysteine S-methyltransferase